MKLWVGFFDYIQAAVIWLKYCRHDVKACSINRSIIFISCTIVNFTFPFILSYVAVMGGLCLPQNNLRHVHQYRNGKTTVTFFRERILAVNYYLFFFSTNESHIAKNAWFCVVRTS